MNLGRLDPERVAEIRARGGVGAPSTDDLVGAAVRIRRALLGSVPEDHRPDLATVVATDRRARTSPRPRVPVLVGLVAALVTAGALAAGSAGVLPSPLQDTVHDGAEIVGVHLPTGDEMREVDIIDVPSDAPLWDDGHHGDAPADGHSHRI